jgi:hypothetical protein
VILRTTDARGRVSPTLCLRRPKGNKMQGLIEMELTGALFRPVAKRLAGAESGDPSVSDTGFSPDDLRQQRA